jgi:hypothetical protein
MNAYASIVCVMGWYVVALVAVGLAFLFALQFRIHRAPGDQNGFTPLQLQVTALYWYFAVFAALIGFQLLLSVVPLYADEAGGGSSGAGLTTAVFMLSTVLTQIQMPRILGRYGYRRTLAAGLLFLGVPALQKLLSGRLHGGNRRADRFGVPFGERAVLALTHVAHEAQQGSRRFIGLGRLCNLPILFE